jgi:hypothetical protein
MGLLDYLFDNQTYSGAGGLLSRLSPSLGQVAPSNGFGPENPISIGNYQMPRIGNPDQYQPEQATLPQNAQPAQGQMPAMPQQQTPTFNNGGLSAGWETFASGGGLLPAITAAVTGQTPGQRQQSELFKAYVGSGLSPSQAYVAVLNPQLAGNLMGGGQTDDIKEYQYAKKEDPTLTFAKFMLQKKANQGEYSLTPQYGTDDKGNTVLIQTGKSGEAIRTKLPEGVKISSGVEKIDAGDKWILYDKRTGTPVGTQPKDLASKEAAEKVGQARGTAQAALANGAETDAEQTKKKIDEFIASKGFNEVFGQLDQYRPSWTHSNEGADALARYKQLKGVTFLTAYQMLKGGGAITDIEGQKAGDAMARLDRAQSEEEAKQALRDFREAVDIGLQKLRRAASGGEAPQAATAAAPKRIRLNADGTIAQ